jgi:small-conductance mechanosensitive channel
MAASWHHGRRGPGSMPDLQELLRQMIAALAAVAEQVVTIWVPIQIALIVIGGLVGWLAATLIRKHFDLAALTEGWPISLRLAVRALARNLGAIIFIPAILLMRAALAATPLPIGFDLIGVVASLTIAWVVIAVLSSAIRNRLIHRLVAALAWTFAALSILGLVGPVSNALDHAALVIGGLRLTALLVLKTTVLMVLALWAASTASRFFDKRLRSYEDLTPSIQVLLGKLLHIGLVTFAVLIVLSSMGIDFSALALFSGAVGVGVGFGLQKIVSNLVSGIILLADKSIKPGDVISLGETYGWVETMGARYISVLSRDGREYLIPNEDFVTQRVINWTYSSDNVRLTVEFGTDVVADPHAVQRVAIEAAAGVPRVLAIPPPGCHFMAFGAKSLDFSLRFWIKDPAEGATNVKSAVRLAIWDALKRDGIPIPPPAQDLRVVTPVQVVRAAE